VNAIGQAERWEQQAARYDSAYDDPGRRGRLVRARLEAALELLGDSPRRVLDIGMGGGRLCADLHRRGWTVTGTDASEAMVELARRRVPELGDSLLPARIEELPFENGSFDAVAALGVLEYAEDVAHALDEVARVLRGGGAAVISWPNFGGLYTAWRGGVVYRLVRGVKRVVPIGRPAPARPRTRVGRRELAALLRQAGLAPESEVLLGAGGRRLGSRVGPSLAAQVVLVARREP
jgi:2-polyprenyl-3-methyl-5-hydroxy-6-metoxy-1,4-benzoquinol methylase